MNSFPATHRGTGSVMSGTGNIVSGPCSYCLKQSVARCSICRSLYCGIECQANHWPLHRRDCTPPPALIWPEDYSVGLPEVEMSSLSDILQGSYFRSVKQEENESEDIENYVSMSTFMKTAELAPKIECDLTSSVILKSENQTSHDLKTEEISMKEVLAESQTEKSGNNSENTNIEENLLSKNEILAESPKKIENPCKTTKTEENLVSINDIVAESKTQKIENPSQTVKIKEDLLKDDRAQSPREKSEAIETLLTPVKIKDNLKLMNEALAEPLEAQPLAYPPAIVSSSIAQYNPVAGVHRVLLPVDHVLSPSHFGICLSHCEDSVLNLMVSMAESPLPVQSDWKVSRNQTVAVCWNEVWYRGVATKKCQDKFFVYLVDLGKVVSVARDLMRPLPEQYLHLPPGCVQVCLAGIGPVQGDVWDLDVIQVFISLLNTDLTYPLGVEFLGKVPGDRWAVRLLGLEDRQNVVDHLVETGLAIRRDDLLSCIAFQFPDTLSSQISSRKDPKERNIIQSQDNLCPQDSSSKDLQENNNTSNSRDTLCSEDSSRKVPKVKKNDVSFSSAVNEGSKNSSKNPCKMSKSTDGSKICQKSTEVSAEISNKGVHDVKCKDIVKVTGGGDVSTEETQVGKSEISAAVPAKVQVTNANGEAPVTDGTETKISVAEVAAGDSSNDKVIQLTKTNEADKSETKLANEPTDKFNEPVIDSIMDSSSFSRIARGSLDPDCSRFKALVCHLDSPSSLYLFPEAKQDLFLEIMTDIQGVSESGSVVGSVGEACLVMQDSCYFRAEIVELSADKGSVKVFLLDDGRSLDLKMDSLKPITCRLKEPGMVLRAGLAGLGPAGNDWSPEEIEAACLMLDVGGETQFDVDVVTIIDGKLNVKLTDSDGVNVAELLVEMGFGVSIPVNYPSNEIALTYGEVNTGPQTVMVCSGISPVQIYITTISLFGLFSNTIFPAVEAAAEAAESVTKVAVGDYVLAHDGEAWYRAEVKQLESETEASVFLLDIGSYLSAQQAQLKRSNPEVFLHPIVAVPAVIMGWEKEDRGNAEKEWGDKMKELVGEPFTELEVEVVESHTNTGRCVIKVPAWNNIFQKKEISRASMLFKKMKSIEK